MSNPFDLSLMTSEELRFLTKPIATYNDTLIDLNKLRKHITLSDLRECTGFIGPKNDVDIGQFAVLPLETVFAIFSNTTIQALLKLRTSNSGLKLLIEAWPPFRNAMTDAKPAVMALIATQADEIWTFSNLQHVIYTKKCELCGEHGEILHLLQLKRVCFKCVTTDRRLLAIPILYALHMGLPENEISALPRLFTIPQRSSWGFPGSRCSLIDYTAAVDVAMTKHSRIKRPEWSFPDPRPRIEVKYKKCHFNGSQGLSAHKFSVRTNVREPLHLRRANKLHQNYHRFNLPHSLLRPPESLCSQHACCIHLPALTLPAASTRLRPIRALLCAGCSFYWNYHNPLPHQTHTLYPHDPTTTVRKSDKYDPKTQTPLLSHLQTCPFARLYWSKLYPPHLTLNHNNPRLATNGGHLALHQLKNEALNHRLTIFLSSNRQHRHFQRHNADHDGTRHVRMDVNNRLFDMMPLQMVEYVHHLRKIPCRTGLEMELERKLADGYDEVTVMLDSTTDDDRFDSWTQTRLSQLQDLRLLKTATSNLEPSNASTKDDNHEVDTFADTLFSTTLTTSQATWATAHASSSQYLFHGWAGLLLERKRKDAEAAARNCGKETFREIEIGGMGWGFDRFGCVSDLG